MEPEETIVKEEPVIEAPETTEEVTEVVLPGAKTESAMLLESLKEEREKRREEARLRLEAETELQRLKSAPEVVGDVFSDEGKALQAQILALQGKLATTETETKLAALQTKFPALKDKEEEFKDYLLNPENSGMRVETAAKAFLTENNLLNTPTTRKGLERDTSGGRVPVKSGFTPDEIDDLRVNNYQEYRKRIKDGTLKMG